MASLLCFWEQAGMTSCTLCSVLLCVVWQCFRVKQWLDLCKLAIFCYPNLSPQTSRQQACAG